MSYLNEKDITGNHIWIEYIGIDTLKEFHIGDLNYIIKNLNLNMYNINNLISIGKATFINGSLITFPWEMNDDIQDENGNYIGTIIDIRIGYMNEILVMLENNIEQFDVQLFDINKKINDGILYYVKEFKMEYPKENPNICTCKCEIVDSFMPVSGDTFKYCRTHKREFIK